MSTVSTQITDPRGAGRAALSGPQRRLVIFGVFALLFAFLFQYRILSLLGRLGFGVQPLGSKFPIDFALAQAPQWALPFLYTAEYLNLVWSATLIGLLMGGAVNAFLPDMIRRWLSGSGWRQQVAGVLVGLPNMLCSCCAVGATAGLRKSGAGRGAAMAFFVTAPSLNLVTLILAFQLLPVKLAIARLLLGIAAAFGVAYAASLIIKEKDPVADFCPPITVDYTVGQMLGRWLGQTAALARQVLPMLLLGFLLIGFLKSVLPFEAVARSLGEGAAPTAAAALAGGILMIPTFAEILWVSEFTRHGMGEGPAVALLITLPAVSLPSLWALGKVLNSYKAAFYLGLFVVALGWVGGLLVSIL